MERSSFVAVQNSDGNFNCFLGVLIGSFQRSEYVRIMENIEDLVRCERTSSQTLRTLLRPVQQKSDKILV